MADPMTIMAGIQLGSSLLGAVGAKRKERRRRRQRRNFFEDELSPLLDEATQDPNVDYGSIREAELGLPTVNFQNQMEQLTTQSNSAMGQSGFDNSGFIQDDYSDQSNQMQEQYNNQVFNIDKGLLDMQSQIESMVNQNKLQAKELKYKYLYG